MEPDDKALYEQLKQFVANQMRKEMDRMEMKPVIIIVFIVGSIIVAFLAWLTIELLNKRQDKKRKEKMERAWPITFTPKIVLKEKKLSLYEGGPDDENKTPEAKIKTSYRFGGSYKMNAHNLIAILQMVFNIADEELIPYYTRTISIKMDGFKHGEACHDFEPIDGAAEGSYYTYQMYGNDAIQVTRYVDNGVSKIAGLCIYVWDQFGEGKHVSIDVIRELMNLKENYLSKEKEKEQSKVIPKNLTKTAMKNVPMYNNSTNLQIKFCPRLQRALISEERNGVVTHQEFDKDVKGVIEESCATCSKKQDDEKPPTYASLT